MSVQDVVVIGAGISGLSFAWKAAQAGSRVLVLEKQNRIGGCFYSRRYEDGFWYELGAHTVYNSYSGLLDIVIATGLKDKLIQRGPSRAHFGLLCDGNVSWLTPPKILLKLNWLEAAIHAPFGFLKGKKGRTVAQYYSGLLGSGNFRRVLSPFFAAVPSQSADDFPAEGPGSLFKTRPRREEFPRSFGFSGGLQSICDAIATNPLIEVRQGSAVRSLLPIKDGYRIHLENGEELIASAVAVAATHTESAALLADSFPALSSAIQGIETVTVESLGARIPRNRCWMPECAFVVPVNDLFFSAVARDPFPDPEWRAFAFHFRAGLTRDQKIRSACKLLRVDPSDLDGIAENKTTLPAPRINHSKAIAEIQKQIEKERRLALVGNYFNGLAVEDCITQSFSEWQRMQS
jgi:protoporphyrinogen/coproporphyrinogen III oxidase